MAEVSLIASVIGIAGAGAKLTVTLYTLAETVNSADKSIRDVARDVSITSSVLSQLASILEQDKKAKISKDDAIKTADEAVRGCSDVFTEIDTALEKSITNINAGKAKAALEKMKWVFNEPKMELLRSNLESMKSSLLLLLSVLSYARDIAADHLGPHDKPNRRLQIVELNRSKANNQRRHEELLEAIKAINITPPQSRDVRTTQGIKRKPVSMESSRAPPHERPYPTALSMLTMTSSPMENQPHVPGLTPSRLTDSTESLARVLALCATRVAHLLERIQSTPNEIEQGWPSARALYLLKYNYKDTRTFLDQRLLVLNHESQVDNVAQDVEPQTYQSYPRYNAVAFDQVQIQQRLQAQRLQQAQQEQQTFWQRMQWFADQHPWELPSQAEQSQLPQVQQQQKELQELQQAHQQQQTQQQKQVQQRPQTRLLEPQQHAQQDAHRAQNPHPPQLPQLPHVQQQAQQDFRQAPTGEKPQQMQQLQLQQQQSLQIDQQQMQQQETTPQQVSRKRITRALACGYRPTRCSYPVLRDSPMPSVPLSHYPESAQEEPDTPAAKRKAVAMSERDPVSRSPTLPSYFPDSVGGDEFAVKGDESGVTSLGYSMPESAPDDVVNALLQKWTTVLDE